MTTNQSNNQQWSWWGFTPPPPPWWGFTPPPPPPPWWGNPPPPPWWGFTPQWETTPPPNYGNIPQNNMPNQNPYWYPLQGPPWAPDWNQYPAQWAYQQYWGMPWAWMPWWGMPPPPMWAWGPPQDEGPVVPIWEFWRDPTFKSNIKLPEHSTKVDEQLFLRLLSWSISLTIDEKKKIIENFWSLSQFQVDELIKIFEEERSKFSALDVKHREQLRALERQHAISWDAYEWESQQKVQSNVEDAQAEDIRKSLGLG